MVRITWNCLEKENLNNKVIELVNDAKKKVELGYEGINKKVISRFDIS